MSGGTQPPYPALTAAAHPAQPALSVRSVRSVRSVLSALLRAWRQQPALARALWAVAELALLAAAVMALVLVPRWQDEADSAQRQALAWRRAAQARPPGPPPAAAPPPWRDSLPAADQAEARLAALLAAAQRQGVAIGRSQQQWRPLAAAQPGTAALSSVQLTMQADASYAALRGWVAQALAADPHLALVGLRLQRSTPDAPRLSAELQWALLQLGDGRATLAPAMAGTASADTGSPR
jgi:hypothetical protein